MSKSGQEGEEGMTRTSDLILSARVARGYYLADKSKSELADELGIRRFPVARLLEAARRDGLVKIEIVSPGAVNTELSARLIEEFGAGIGPRKVRSRIE
jgi:DNA-binding transcriptional regulator LsrR (DeoR family)